MSNNADRKVLWKKFFGLPKWRRLVGVVLGTCVAVIVLTVLFQERLIYFPTRDYDMTPANSGLDFEDVTLVTADGVTVAAWFVPRQGARAAVLFFHGNAGNNGDRGRRPKRFIPWAAPS